MADSAPLRDDELNTFFDDISNGMHTINRTTICEAFYRTHKKLFVLPEQSPARLSRVFSRGSPAAPREDIEKHGLSLDRETSDAFLQMRLGDSPEELDRDEFYALVRTWNIPSQKKPATAQEDEPRKIPLNRRFRAFWSIDGPKVALIFCVVTVQVSFAVWQLVVRLRAKEARAAFGWGLILAKTCSGLLYPTLFLMILSMSRYFTTHMRRFRHISKVANWDRTQSFHIWMALVALVAATLHGIGHLSGTFLYGSLENQDRAVSMFLMEGYTSRPYSFFIASRYGWTGIASLGLFWIIAVLSTPWIRKRWYECFQLAHLLGYPLVALLCVHGTAKLIQQPILGYFLALPTLFVILERLLRAFRSFHRIPARVQLLDDDMVSLTFQKPHGAAWSYKAGQYVLLQVPVISFWQWHPYTISSCQQDTLQLHIKNSGRWTASLHALPVDQDVLIGIDGPFGAPAQRLFDCDRAIVIASGVGMTPFSAILTHLEMSFLGKKNPWSRISDANFPYLNEENSVDSFKTAQETQVTSHSSVTLSQSPGKVSTAESPSIEISGSTALSSSPRTLTTEDTPANSSSHRLDFHWIVRERRSLLWFASLLNRVHDLSQGLPGKSLELNIQTHITLRDPDDVTTHICRHLLDSCGTLDDPYSRITGLRTTSKFGRPDLAGILREFHTDMLRQGWSSGQVGVFFCGNPAIGRTLSDACTQLTVKSRLDGSNIVYAFREEVFG